MITPTGHLILALGYVGVLLILLRVVIGVQVEWGDQE